VDVAGVRFELPDGRVLLEDVSFRVGDGAKVALVGANGAGKTTLLRIITGDLVPQEGVVTRTGGLGVMRQMVGHGLKEDATVAELLDVALPFDIGFAHRSSGAEHKVRWSIVADYAFKGYCRGRGQALRECC